MPEKKTKFLLDAGMPRSSGAIGAKVGLVTPDALESLIRPTIMGEAVYA